MGASLLSVGTRNGRNTFSWSYPAFATASTRVAPYRRMTARRFPPPWSVEEQAVRERPRRSTARPKRIGRANVVRGRVSGAEEKSKTKQLEDR